MKNTHKVLFSAIGLVLATGMAISQPSIKPSGESLLVSGIEASNGAILRVIGPNGYRFTQEFRAGENISVDLKDTPFAKDGQRLSELAAGTYTYELTSRPGGKQVQGTFRIGDAPEKATAPRTQIQEEVTTPPAREAVLQAAAAQGDEAVVALDTDTDGLTQLILESTPAGGTTTNWKVRNNNGVLDFQSVGGTTAVHMQMDPTTGRLELLTGGLTAAGSIVTGSGGLVSNGPITSTGGLTTSTTNGRIGIGTNTPVFPLEINNANALMVLSDTDGGSNWKIQNQTGQFSIGTATQKVLIIEDGSLSNSLVISSAGVSVTSSRSLKTNIKQTSAEDILAKLEELPIYTWSYTKDKSKSVHIGPMAEEFHQRFGFGDDAKRISSLDTGGLALAGVKALQKELDKRDAEIAELKTQVALLLERSK